MTHIEELREVIRKLHGVEGHIVKRAGTKKYSTARRSGRGSSRYSICTGIPKADTAYAWSMRRTIPAHLSAM